MAVRPSKAMIKKHNIPTYGKAEISEDQLTAKKTWHSENFQKLCEELGISPTKRQASKFNKRSGRWADTP